MYLPAFASGQSAILAHQVQAIRADLQYRLIGVTIEYIFQVQQVALKTSRTAYRSMRAYTLKGNLDALLNKSITTSLSVPPVTGQGER